MIKALIEVMPENCVGCIDRGTIFCLREECIKKTLASLRFGVLWVVRGKGLHACLSCSACGNPLFGSY